jgi:hypothetical protein
MVDETALPEQPGSEGGRARREPTFTATGPAGHIRLDAATHDAKAAGRRADDDRSVRRLRCDP